MQPAGRDADISGDALRGVQQRLAFANGNALFDRGKRQQVVKSPHAAKTVRIVAAIPFSLEIREFFGHRQFIPGVNDIEQAAAFFASDAGFIDGVSFATRGKNALLIGFDGHGAVFCGW